MKRNILFLTIALLVLVGCVAPEPAAPVNCGRSGEPRMPPSKRWTAANPAA
ncbi:MAG: hypothetical protein R2873_03835 [Caldilineaceae bacterium]